MTRRLSTACALVAASVAVAAPVPKTAPAPAPKTGATITLATAKMNGELIQVSQTVNVTRIVQVQEVVKQDGQEVTITKQVPQTQQVQQVVNLPLKGIKASTADGKEISEEDLAKKLGDGAAVVQVPAGFDPEWRKLFADDVLFLESSGVRGGVVRPGVGIAPAVPLVPVIRPLPGLPVPAVPPPAVDPVPPKKEEKK
ncbi:MAG: hypothetical protein MUF18_05740 [Fimbriiglobus sp.]|jgi:hypothetical protein|nr:hypothetical protein [Fimbriiglobus sp.]